MTQKRLKELFDYDSKGLLIRKISIRHKLKGSVAGYKMNNGYYRLTVDQRQILLHRAIFLWHHGEIPNQIDHINRLKTDNRIENLRSSDQSNNLCNRKSYKSNTSGFKGVTWSKQQKNG